MLKAGLRRYILYLEGKTFKLSCSCNSLCQGFLLEPKNQVLFLPYIYVIILLCIFNKENAYENRRFWNLAALERTSVLEHELFLYTCFPC